MFVRIRFLLVVSLLSLAVLIPPATADKMRHHALSLIGEPKYPADFTNFRYVNPNAPKGGAIRLPAIGSFDSLNPFILKGVSATGVSLIYDQLMETSLDEPSTAYGLIAEWMTYPDDFSTATFKLRDGARWHDGKPVSPEDVIFSLEAMKKGHPFYGQYYKNVVKAEKTGPREVTFTFNVKNNRELPMIVGELTILPKHYWTSNDADGNPRDITKTTLDPPLGSGPYRIKEVKAGRSMTLERVKDYWAAKLPVKLGKDNFDEIRFEYYRDSTIAFEAFKADRLDFYRETSSKNWATGYDLKTVKKGMLKRRLVELKRGQPMQAFVLNTRHEKFQDPRVRRAFNLAFDFEWANKNLFYGQYRRVSSYFENTELASSGLPEGRELEILNEIRDQVPPEVFTTPYTNPVSDGSGSIRRNLRAATKLFKAAGWSVKDRKLVNDKTGRQMTASFLLVSPQFERIVQPYSRNLERLGIKVSLRVVDPPQYSRRLDSFDFDIIVGNFSQSQSPGNEQRGFWGSAAADKKGSRNLIGVKNPAIDRLIDKIIFAKDRSELVAATRALDRVLLWNHYVVPQWYAPYSRIAYWDRFGAPETLPSQSVGFPDIWWWNEDAAKKLAEAK
ncbi:MAG TPA: ABC transporter substrate-binding protein [Rhizobiales bacterium]|nr:oligopeptide-binding protein AppA precursor [bacterium BMS3Bbin10]HDO52714.1 ABC transporter substrate-binding protein [Hyphomicrobiales bacterium]